MARGCIAGRRCAKWGGWYMSQTAASTAIAVMVTVRMGAWGPDRLKRGRVLERTKMKWARRYEGEPPTESWCSPIEREHGHSIQYSSSTWMVSNRCDSGEVKDRRRVYVLKDASRWSVKKLVVRRRSGEHQLQAWESREDSDLQSRPRMYTDGENETRAEIGLR